MKLELPAKPGIRFQREFIKACEHRFDSQLDDLAFRLTAPGKKLRVVALCGPSCSGKTTTAKKIISSFSRHGRRVVTFSIDDFYKDRYVYQAECEKNGKPFDLESINAIDVSYLGLCFERMLEGKEAMLPIFDFSLAERVRYIPYNMKEDDVVLLEGIQSMYPSVRAMLDGFDPFYIFIDAAGPLETPNGVFTGRQLRLVRRLVRDFYMRGSSAARTFTLWKQVIGNEDGAIYPYKDLAHFSIDSTMAYEPMMFKKHLFTILGSISQKEEYYKEANEILLRHEPFPDFEERLLPPNSVFHEFL